MSDYPSSIVPVNHVEPVPRRVRATRGETTVVDTRRALYVWEHRAFPQYYVPLDDVREGVLVDEEIIQHSPRGDLGLHAVQIDGDRRSGAAKVLTRATVDGLDRTVRFEWSAFDAWFEEDEQVFVHPRSPYARVDALRSTRTVRVELQGVVLAETSSPVMVFETGLPTRHYINRTEVDFSRLVASSTVTECPYKGTTSGYWSVRIGGDVFPDLAWSYEFPTRQVDAIAGMIAFYDERVDTFVDGEEQARPKMPSP